MDAPKRKPTEAEFLAAMELLIKNAKSSPNGSGPSEEQLRAMLNAGMKKREQMENNSESEQTNEQK